MPVQHCHRCRAQVPVQGLPLPWCPRCGGLLSAPLATAPWTTRWVAHPPPGTRAPLVADVGEPGPTPRYDGVPSWGLPSRPWVQPLDRPPPPPPGERAEILAASLRPLLLAASVALVVAALAQGWRYALVLQEQGPGGLISARTAGLSDLAVAVTAVLAPVLVVVATLVGSLWLLRARRAAVVRAGLRDTRSERAVVLGVWVPGWNLAQAGVLVTELERLATGSGGAPSPRVRGWWAGWVLSLSLAAAAWLWPLWGTTQSEVDAVVLSGLADLAGAACTALAWLLVGSLTTRLAASAGPPVRRWVPARSGA